MLMDPGKLFANLQKDRLIQVIIGTGPNRVTLNIQEAILNQLSPHFKRMMSTGTSTTATLRLPENDRMAWQALFYWIIERRLPDLSSTSFRKTLREVWLVRFWVLGNHYGIVDFQDEVMLRLLWIYKGKFPFFAPFKMAIERTESGSPLRALMLEGAAAFFSNEVQEERPRYATKMLKYIKLEGHLAEDFVHATIPDERNKFKWLDRTEDENWKRYMVGSKFSEHFTLGYTSDDFDCEHGGCNEFEVDENEDVNDDDDDED